MYFKPKPGMGRNLFYDLPIELINLVYKQYHTNYVLKQLLTRPGNFSFMDTDWADILEQDYRVVDNIPGAWEFLRVCDYNFIMYANRRNVIFKKIYNSINIGNSLYILQFIAKNGWGLFRNYYN